MTALGLVVAVPAVLAYNWLIRRNKSIMEDLAAFTNDLHGYLMSDGRVKPRVPGVTGPAVSNTARTKTAAAPTQPGTEPLRAGQTSTGAQATPTSAE
jgi:biopolymer transport protein ExbB